MADEELTKPGRIKPVSRPIKSAFNRMRAMTNFVEVDRRVRLGWSTHDIANSIHEEFKELTDISIKYLKKMLDRYRAGIPEAELSMVSPASLLGRNIAKRMAQGIDELAEIERLYQAQISRIDIDMANEKTINKLLPTTGHEIFVAMKLLKQSSDLKMDLGLIKRQLGSVEVTGQLAAEAGSRYGRESVSKVITDPSSRKKVLDVAEKLLAFASKAGFDATDIASQLNGKIIEATGEEKSIEQAPEESNGDQGK